MDKKGLIALVKEINVLRLTPKDILVVKLPEVLSTVRYDAICKVFSEVFELLGLSADNLVITTVDLNLA